ncbi:extensin-1-like [Amaranthus tricolor]|uniref:extensin-1-like n=1 Tax=Amaranthus tricolor TaxID=29722 RepID=UPI00258884AF|nr:extensin-1-like [Amaranthus tricolor]
MTKQIPYLLYIIPIFLTLCTISSAITSVSKQQIACTMCDTCENPCQPPIITVPPPPPQPECPPPPSPTTTVKSPPGYSIPTFSYYSPPPPIGGGSGGGGGGVPRGIYGVPSPPNPIVPYFPYYYYSPPPPKGGSSPSCLKTVHYFVTFIFIFLSWILS